MNPAALFTPPLQKPRLKLRGGFWYCIGEGTYHYARTPRKAYIGWVNAATYNRNCRP